MSGKQSRDQCCWCLKGEERQRHLINTETKEGTLADRLRLCQSYLLILRSCVAAETRLSECKSKLLEVRSPTVPWLSMLSVQGL